MNKKQKNMAIVMLENGHPYNLERDFIIKVYDDNQGYILLDIGLSDAHLAFTYESADFIMSIAKALHLRLFIVTKNDKPLFELS